MSKIQYKRGNTIDILQKVRSLSLVQSLNISKPCLLMIDIYGIGLALVSNNATLWYFVHHHHNNSSYMKITYFQYNLFSQFFSKNFVKAVWQYILNAVNSVAEMFPHIFIIKKLKIMEQ